MNINDTLQYQNIGLPDDILRRKLHGDFEGAIRLIDRRLKEENLSDALRHSLRVHREMILRLPEEFPYSRAEAIDIIRRQIPDFTEEEFDELVDSRRIRWIYVNGEMRIFNRFFSSLCKAYPGFAQRAGEVLPGVESAVGGVHLLDHAMAVMKERGSMTNRIRIRASMRIKDEHFTPGMFVRAHLPIPSACQQQRDIRIEKVYPESGKPAPEDAPQRTVCWEEHMTENHEFVVEYSYLHTARYHDTSAMHAEPRQLDFDIQEEAPHIVFTPYIRQLARELTAGMTDPLCKARAFYDFITLNMNYTFMPSYFVLDNIAEACARNYTGDCGVFALLFLTLCRCVGIPAQWQSGFAAEPGFCGGHDWVRFYVEPYGWLYADTSYGVSARRNGNEERRRFYFGNLDPYRMVANSAFAVNFTVSKEHWRADPYDNQVGEIETADRGLTYDEFVRAKEILLCEEV
ncbi:MAG: transglutaminase domain-containing protein [Oscillospiraceae bacterium]|nr:transglutaminase domain-containing protein [Oscillospiraceae bacterium]